MTIETNMRSDLARAARQPCDVLFVLPHMGRGGAQRVISLVANAWARQGKRICILTWNDGREEAHDLDPRIERISLGSFSQGWWKEFRERGRVLERRLRPLWKKDQPEKKRRTAPTEVRVRKSQSDPLNFHDRLALSAIRRFDQDKRNRVLEFYALVVKRLLARQTLGYRIGGFRDVLTKLEAPVVVSLLTKTNLYVLSAARGMKCRVVVSERNDPELQQLTPKLAALRELVYRDADAVTSNSVGVLAKMSAFVPSEKLKILPNPVMVPKIVGSDLPRSRSFVTVARLVHQKGIDLLLSAFSRIAHEVPDWNLDIVGDGPLYDELVAYAETLGIADRVKFHGYVEGPTRFLQSCRVFVLPSRFEGMPNALLEAMACGLAPIVTDASPGPLECVRHNESGLVVATENVEEMAEAMLRLATNEELTDRLARQATAYVKEHDWTTVERQWLDVLGMRADEAEVRPAQRLEALQAS